MKLTKRSNHILPQDNEFIRACRGRLAKQLKIAAENLLAGMSSEYLASIREAREDYRQGRILSHDKVFTFPKRIEAEDADFVRACRERLAKQLKKDKE